MYDLIKEILARKERIGFRYVRDGKEFTVTYEQYYRNICECYHNLTERLGDISGKHIAIAMNNCYEYLVTMPAIIFGGAAVLPVNILESAETVSIILKKADTCAIVIKDAESESYDIPNVIPVKDICTFTDQGDWELPNYEENPDRIALMIHTSGTTGRPKGVMELYRNLFYRKKHDLPKEYILDPSKDDPLNTILTFPLYHQVGVCCWLSWCTRGCTTFINENPGDILNDFKNNRFDFTLATPAVMKLLGKRLKRGKVDELGGIKSIGSAGAPIQKDIIDLFLENGISYVQIYGLTETGEITYNYDNGDHVMSVGLPIEDTKVCLIDGEICVDSGTNCVGYYKNQQATDELIRDGWIHTGDLGDIDDEGYIYIVGRKKNLIILSGGENVSPEEIEELLYSNESIKECRVFEQDDKIYAEIFANESDHDGIRDFVTELNKKLPIFKRIYRVVFSETDLEKTAAGKIRRKYN